MTNPSGIAAQCTVQSTETQSQVSFAQLRRCRFSEIDSSERKEKIDCWDRSYYSNNRKHHHCFGNHHICQWLPTFEQFIFRSARAISQRAASVSGFSFAFDQYRHRTIKISQNHSCFKSNHTNQASVCYSSDRHCYKLQQACVPLI